MAKFCVSCGTQLEDNQDFCTSCGAPQNNQAGQPQTQAQPGVTSTPTDPQMQTQAQPTNPTNPEAKSKIAAGLLGIFLGAFGVHNFYLGYTGKAVAQLLITILTCGLGAFISGTWGLIEGILILVGNINKDANGVQLAD